MLEKTNIENIYRDPNTNVLINKDNRKLNGYKIQKQKMRDIEILKQEVDSLKEQNFLLKNQIENMNHSLQILLKKVK